MLCRFFGSVSILVEVLQPRYSTTDFYTILSHDTQPGYSATILSIVVEVRGSVSWLKSVVEVRMSWIFFVIAVFYWQDLDDVFTSGQLSRFARWILHQYVVQNNITQLQRAVW
jgi:hypothetical protein